MNLILGQGIAGSVLALVLLEKGEEVVVVDNGHRSSSSMVAAGLWNPIVFRRINKGWLADELVAALEDFYPRQEKVLGASFFHPLPIWRKHSSTLEASLWEEKGSTSEFSEYLAKDHPNHTGFGEFAHGSGTVKHAGYVDLPVFLAAVKSHLQRLGAYREMEIDLPATLEELQQLQVGVEPVKRVIDCRGYKTALSPWWNYLPFGLTKGEVLGVRCPGLNLHAVFNAGFFLQPLGGDNYRMGATFNWSDKDEIPTPEAKQELLEKYHRHIAITPQVTDHRAGVRPTVQDRRPLLGKHPDTDSLYIFNGLGTKGVMLAPWLAGHFADHITLGNPLPVEADIQRFEHLKGIVNPTVNYPIRGQQNED